MKGMAFSAEMAQAIYEGRKTQTRRVMEPQPDAGKMRWNGAYWEMHMGYPLGHDVPLGKYSIGERLFVQEPWFLERPATREEWLENKEGNPWRVPRYYRVRVSPIPKVKEKGHIIDWKGSSVATLNPTPWLPPKSMPQWAARSIIEITNIRVEPLQDITEEDAKAEGVKAVSNHQMQGQTVGQEKRYTEGFAMLWQNFYRNDLANGRDANPWVWVYEFERVEGGK